jgi:Dehydrogenases with different specificities (related to short-chain alcohol dehydrogenases)
MQGKLEGKVVIITGGGSGIGKSMASLFSREGAKVVLVDVVDERVKEVTQELKKDGREVLGMTLDISVKENAEKVVNETIRVFKRIDVLCNNAGIMDGFFTLTETADELLERVMRVNLYAPFWMSRRAIPHMLREGRGVIVNTASVAGLYGGKAGTAYTVSKHALIGLTRSIAAQYGPRGIRCNAIAPGGVITNITSNSKMSQEGMELLKRSVAPPPAEPEQIAKVALFLASDDSFYVNGEVLVADAGWTVY